MLPQSRNKWKEKSRTCRRRELFLDLALILEGEPFAAVEDIVATCLLVDYHLFWIELGRARTTTGKKETALFFLMHLYNTLAR
jgi:hypothetical protein